MSTVEELEQAIKISKNIQALGLVHPAVVTAEPSAYVAGITKRELFAAMAMQGLMTSPAISCETKKQGLVASISVWMADALLAELAKGKP